MMLVVMCEDVEPFLRVIHYLINVVKFLIPIVLIIMITIDITKTVTGKDKNFFEIKLRIINRILYSLLIFLVPTIVSFVFKNVFGNYTSELDGPKAWLDCYTLVNYNDETYIPSAKLSCDDVSIIMKVGETYDLKCRSSNNKKISYETNSDIVSLDNNRITALKVGYAVVNVLTNNRYTNVSVTVLQNTIDVTDLSVNNKVVNLEVFKSFTIKYKILPQNATVKDVTYSNYDTGIIKITGDTITALREGETKVKACSYNRVCDEFLVSVKNKDVCDNDFIKPNINIDNKYLTTTYSKTNLIAYEDISFKVNASDNCNIKNISYCLKKIDENDVCESNIVISNDGFISLKKIGEYKIIISAVDQSGNSSTNIYYAIRGSGLEETPHKEDSYNYTCYLGYACNKGYYRINYDEVLGSCYEDTKWWFIKTGRNRLGYPVPKFYTDISVLNDDITNKRTGLVSGYDDAKATYRFIYKCESSCEKANPDICIGYAYYDPITNKIAINRDVVDNWSYFSYLKNQ